MSTDSPQNHQQIREELESLAPGLSDMLDRSASGIPGAEAEFQLQLRSRIYLAAGIPQETPADQPTAPVSRFRQLRTPLALAAVFVAALLGGWYALKQEPAIAEPCVSFTCMLNELSDEELIGLAADVVLESPSPVSGEELTVVAEDLEWTDLSDDLFHDLDPELFQLSDEDLGDLLYQ